MPQQLELFFKPRDATPQEQKEWIEGELQWWGDNQLKIVAIAALVQVGVFGLMLASFYFIGELVK
tara:strand:- start:274 stop:468 length:195 start_codon:yes stop_codon:yes gene_type:complete